MMQWSALAGLALAAALAWPGTGNAAAASPAAAQAERTYPPIPMVHTRWLVKDGAPPNIRSIAQTPDGWLWMATPVGLFRFDGVRFTQYQPPAGVDMSTNIAKLGVLDDGTLWIAPRLGGVLLLRGGKLQAFGRASGLSGESVNSVVRDRAGRIWLPSGRAGLMRLSSDGSRWESVSRQFGLPETALREIMLDSRGTMWVMGVNATYARAEGATAFVQVAEQQGWGEVQEAPDGTVWASDMGAQGLHRLYFEEDDPRHQAVMRGIHVSEFLIDRRGNMWFAGDTGVSRIQLDSPTAQRQDFGPRQGLTGQYANIAFQDREGTVWVATDSGLDQFRDSRMREIVLPPYAAESRPLLAGPDGDLWIDHLYLRDPGATPQPFGPPSAQATLTSALYRDPHGTVWSNTLDGLWRLDGLQRVRIPYPPTLATRKLVSLFGIATDDDEALWISTGVAGTWRLKAGTWTQFGGQAALTRLSVLTMVRAGDGALWFGSVDNTLAILRRGAVRKLAPVPGLTINAVMQIVPHGSGAWLGGEGGVAWFDGARAHAILGQAGERFAGATGVVLAPDGALWLNTGRGLVGIAAAELRLALADPAYRVAYTRYDENDGLIGTAAPLLPMPSMVRTPSGELIISTTASVFRFDPARAATNRIAPSVQITGINSDGREFAPGRTTVLPSGPDTVRIDYTALSLALPRRVRFRYRLDGVDQAWQDPGARRAAFYTQLGPGTYTFRVIAANDDGVWNETGAQLVFEVPPTPTQTVWFKLLCAALFVLAVWGLYRLRLRAAMRRMTQAFDVRVAERERIARDLHDTLLQSVQGLLLVFRRVALRTPETDPNRPLMDQALTLAVDTLAEGRDKVVGLRISSAADAELGADLDAYGSRMAQLHPVAFSLKREGRVRRLLPAVIEELQAIGREALRNAFAHAQATRIDIELVYGERLLTLVVRDDGRGMQGREAGQAPGHWGVPGMRERAAGLGATLELTSDPGHGTTWRLQLPARLAYADAGTPQPSTPDSAAVAP